MRAGRHGPRWSAGACAALLLSGGCSFTDSAAWTDQLHPSGACYEVNLLDGLDSSDTSELHLVYACLNAGGGLEGFRPVDTAWDTTTRDGLAGVVFAQFLADVDLGDTSLAGLLGDARAAIEDPEPLWDTLHLGLELTYGTAWPRVATLATSDPAVLDAGLLGPGQLLAGDVAATLLDHPGVETPLVELLESDALRRLAWTLEGVARSSEAPLVVVATRWPDDVAALLDAVTSPENDRAASATGNSLADLLGAVMVRQASDGRAVWQHLATPLVPLLADEDAGAAVGASLQAGVARGDVPRVPNQVLYLLSVDASGAPVSGADLSTLSALIRLLRNGNTEVACTVDLGFTDIDINLGNLSVSLLTTFAGLDPNTAESGVGLFGDLLGVPLTADALALIADSGVCPVIDQTFVDDLQAIDRLTDPEADAVLPVLIGLLGALDAHIPEVVDTAGVLWDLDLLPPLEDCLRDTLGSALLADLLPALPALLDPTGWYDTSAMPVAPVDWPTAWGWAGVLLDPDGPLVALQPLITEVVESQSTWRLAARGGVLLAMPDALTRTMLPRVADAVEADPTLTTATDLAGLLQDSDRLRPILVLAEADGLRAALMTSSTLEPGPIPSVTAWTLDGTLDRALGAVSTLSHLLDVESR